jgi:hypothetical protein
MDIKNLRKNYDKLTVKERFAAIVAAGMRGDDQERKALLQSAPRKRFSIPDTWGISEAFEWAATWHVMNQLGYAASFYYLLFSEDENFKIADVTYNDAMILIQRRILTEREAWRAICKEYGVDPEKILEGLPYIEMIDLTELTARAAYIDAPLELPELQETIDGLRAAIEYKRKDWE